MDPVLDLLDQILVIAREQAVELDAYNILRHKALKTVGKNAIVHNLEMLRELIVSQQVKCLPDVTLGNTKFTMSYGAVTSTRRFPIMSPPGSIPWDTIASHERQADLNHGQSLEQLASRGGLSPSEAVAILEDRGWHAMKPDESLTRLSELAQWNPIR